MYNKFETQVKITKEELFNDIKSNPYLLETKINFPSTNFKLYYDNVHDNNLELYAGKSKAFSYFSAKVKIVESPDILTLSCIIKGTKSFYVFLPLVIFFPLLTQTLFGNEPVDSVQVYTFIKIGIFGMLFLLGGTFLQAYFFRRKVIENIKTRERNIRNTDSKH